jgi:LytR cell envelope-related transcriptional attenuator
VEHVQPFHRPFPWRLAVLATCAVVFLTLLTLVGMRLVRDHQAAAGTRPAAGTGSGSEGQVVPLRPRSRVSVLVLNGNGTSGVAGSTASRLLGRGYASATATNAANDGYATSLVLYRPGWDGEARRLAKDAGIKVVAALDGRLPAGSARAQLVLILGAN